MATRGASSGTPMTEGGARSASWQTCTIAEIIQQTPSIKSFFLRLSEPFAHIAGQHVDVRLTAPDGYVAMRSYSIASSPSASKRLLIARISAASCVSETSGNGRRFGWTDAVLLARCSARPISPTVKPPGRGQVAEEPHGAASPAVTENCRGVEAPDLRHRPARRRCGHLVS